MCPAANNSWWAAQKLVATNCHNLAQASDAPRPPPSGIARQSFQHPIVELLSRRGAAAPATTALSSCSTNNREPSRHATLIGASMNFHEQTHCWSQTCTRLTATTRKYGTFPCWFMLILYWLWWAPSCALHFTFPPHLLIPGYTPDSPLHDMKKM